MFTRYTNKVFDICFNTQVTSYNANNSNATKKEQVRMHRYRGTTDSANRESPSLD